MFHELSFVEVETCCRDAKNFVLVPGAVSQDHVCVSGVLRRLPRVRNSSWSWTDLLTGFPRRTDLEPCSVMFSFGLCETGL